MNHHEHDKLPHVIEGKREAELLQKRLDAEYPKRFDTTGVDPQVRRHLERHQKAPK